MKRQSHGAVRALRAAMLVSTALFFGGVAVQGAAAQDFEAVLAAPDDPDVNLAFARDAISQGDLIGAAAALERVLIADPNRHGARLLYAVVLYRLEDLQGARDQLDLLEPVTLTPLQRAEAAKYRGKIERGRSATRVDGGLSVALTYEEDAAGALSTQFDPILAPASDAEGSSTVITARLNVTHDLAGAPGHSVYGGVAASDKSTFDGADGDIRRGEAELGLSYLGRLNGWNAGVVVRAVELLDNPYLVEVGVRGQARWRVSNATTVSLSGEAVNQAFDEPTVDAAAALLLIDGNRDGWRYDVKLGISHRISGRSSVGLSLGWQDKQADYEPFAYSGPGVQAHFDTSTRRGQYLTLAAGAQFLEYDAPDPFFLGFGSPTREDVRSWARVAIGAPISAFTPSGGTGDWREDLNVEAALTYGARESEAPLADYDSWGAELRLAWRFGGAN